MKCRTERCRRHPSLLTGSHTGGTATGMANRTENDKSSSRLKCANIRVKKKWGRGDMFPRAPLHHLLLCASKRTVQLQNSSFHSPFRLCDLPLTHSLKHPCNITCEATEYASATISHSWYTNMFTGIKQNFVLQQECCSILPWKMAFHKNIPKQMLTGLNWSWIENKT